MAVKSTQYDPLKVTKIRTLLEESASKGYPRQYEIFVDNLKVVPRTDDVTAFDGFEFYIDDDTEQLKILLYNSPSSPRNDQYCFVLKEKKYGQHGLNGLGEIEGIVQQKLDAQNFHETKKKLQEAEEYIGELEEQIEQLKKQATDTKYKLGKLDLVELGSVLLENLAAKNSGLLGKVGLSGLGGPAQLAGTETEETEVSFQKKKEPEETIDETYKVYLPFIQQLDETFEQEDLQKIMQVLRKFADDPQQLTIVAELLNIK